MMKRFSGVGICSLLTVILVLCLSIFAALCLSSANAEKRLSESYAQSIEAYYSAENEAELILASLRQGQLPEGVTLDGEIYTYSCEISEGRSLYVAVKITDGEYEIINWQGINDSSWESDDSLDLWEGE